METSAQHPTTQAYLIGAGIASLAGAVFLIRDAGVPGQNIHIIEEADTLGGCLDAQGTAETGYLSRGGRVFDELAHSCLFDLLSTIPAGMGHSLRDEILAFNLTHRYHSHCRLVEHGQRLDTPAFGLSWLDRLALMKLWLMPEWLIGPSRIQDLMPPGFFRTNYWAMWCTIFAFQPWHSAMEFRRYMLRLVQWVHTLATLSGVSRTPLNQYEYLILPIARWLKERGVQFHTNTQVVNLDFISEGAQQRVEAIQCIQGGVANKIKVPAGGLVFATLGSMTALTRIGTMTAPIQKLFRASEGAWALWETLAREHPEFGKPAVFNGNTALSRWQSFTLTLRTPLFPDLVTRFTGNATGTGGLVTFKDSAWLLSAVMLHRPHFSNQPDHVNVCWGYGLFPDRPGDYVHKPMSSCTGAEILEELCHHFGFQNQFQEILATSTCIPCEMPFITSQFMPRSAGDRPPVTPKGYSNLALMGQYCEIPSDTVFTVEYSVRSAQTAVYSLMKLDRKVQPIYKGYYHPLVMLRAARALFG